jgi:tRNA pseudouridine55 synthase
VRDVKRRLALDKVGHLGTLDPFATGLLPLCLGEGSKVVPFLNQEDKAYAGRMRLGIATDTLDATGTETERASVPPVTAEVLAAVATRFTGEIEQVPPMYSALKRSGVPLYRLARQGIEVERAPRRVCIHSLRLRAESPDRVDFEVHCSKGTYVRSLAADLARALGTVGHLSTLRRTRFGAFSVDDAAPLEDVRPGVELALKSPREVLGTLRELAATDRLEAQIRKGQQWALSELPPPQVEAEMAKVVSPGGLVAVLEAAEGSWRIVRVFSPGIA